MAKFIVFIHTNPQQYVGAKVSEYSLRRHSRHNDKFDVRILNSVDYPHLHQCEGRTYRRKGTVATWRNRDLQSFSLLRFLPPQVVGFQGRALVIDPDIFAVADVYDLLNRDMGGKAILCRKTRLEPGKPLFWATSVMLLDCARLPHWQWHQDIDAMFNHQFDYGDWIALRREPENTIGELEEEWNHFDTLTERTRLLHTTERSTQPWKTGLPVDFNLNYPMPAKLRGWQAVSKWVLQRLGRGPRVDLYKPHPDPNQERLFFTLLNEAVGKGILTREFLHNEIRQQHLRPDALQLLKAS